MHDLGLVHSKPFRWAAEAGPSLQMRACRGQGAGQIQPSVYDGLVCLAQEFTMQAPLVEGHSNLGFVENDPPAAMRSAWA